SRTSLVLGLVEGKPQGHGLPCPGVEGFAVTDADLPGAARVFVRETSETRIRRLVGVGLEGTGAAILADDLIAVEPLADRDQDSRGSHQIA
ncbi:MAG: hypothetical protein KAI47_25435, partial [Deltaproteobacteria bacterium]|nr:hypothetical protein [Deltaproteobacteria bacterium]